MNSLNEYHAERYGREYAWIDFANSLEWNGFGKTEDHLIASKWLTLFLQHWNLAHRVPADIPQEELVRLRSFLRRMAEKLSTQVALKAADIATLNTWLKVPAQQRVVRGPDGVRLELRPIDEGWGWIVSRIAASLAEMLEHGESERLKICPNKGCRWIFYDQTKGKTRRWCSDRTCGNRDRVRRSRAAAKKKK
jgi:predicted RNA-binding Zn ribbon-like protein